MQFKERYQYNVLTDQLGKGGFARVYKAYDNLLDREVAIKVFNVSSNTKGSVLEEIKRAIKSKLHHPNLITYYDAAVLENTNAFGEVEKMELGVMEYANSGDLKNFMRQNKDLQLLNKLLVDVLNGLTYLHAKGIIHRDLKPQNILLHKEDGELSAKISDFGISKKMDSDGSSSALMGTIEYMAPEQFEPKSFGIDGKISTNLDIWSFGIMIYELFTGKQPFGQRGGDTTAEQIMKRILAAELPEDINTIPQPYRDIIRRCLVTDAKMRTRNCRELIPLLQNGEDGYTASEYNYQQPGLNNEAGIETEVIAKPKQDSGKVEVTPEPEAVKKKTGGISKILRIVVVTAALVTVGSLIMYRYINSGNKDYPAALRQFDTEPAAGLQMMRNLAVNADDSAIHFLATYYWQQQQYDSALVYLGQSEDPISISRLGEIHQNGWGSTKKNEKAAVDYFQKAMDKGGDTTAALYLSEYYYAGKAGVERDLNKAFEYARSSAEKGSIRGAINLAALYFNGEGTAPNNTEALRWYTKAAEAGDAYSNFVVGYFYQNGVSVKKDINTAVEFYKKAAAAGDPSAAQALRSMGK